MQIFEITYKRRNPKLNEIDLSGVASVGKALATTAQVKAGQYIKSQTGIDPAQPDSNPYGAQQSRAAAAAKPIIDQQAKEQHKLWIQALNQSMQEAGVASIAAIPPAIKSEIERSLLTQIHTNLLRNSVGRDYTQLPRFVSNDPAVQTEATKLVKQITDAKNELMNFSRPDYDAASLRTWQTLAQSAYEAMALTRFQSGSLGNAMNILSRMGITPSQITQIRTMTNRLGPASTPSAVMQDYLQIFGFRPYSGLPARPGAPAAERAITAVIPKPRLDAIADEIKKLPDISRRDPETQDWLSSLGMRL